MSLGTASTGWTDALVVRTQDSEMTCVAGKKIADDFASLLVKRAKSLPLGDPRKADPVVLGSIICMDTVEHCNASIEHALAKGEKLLCGGKADSTLMPATVLDHVTRAMRIYSEETFGPVKCMVRVDGAEAAVACANDCECGLSTAWRGASRVASALSTAPRCITKRRCLSAASSAAASAVLAARPGWPNLRSCAGSRCSWRRGTFRFERTSTKALKSLSNVSSVRTRPDGSAAVQQCSSAAVRSRCRPRLKMQA